MRSHNKQVRLQPKIFSNLKNWFKTLKTDIKKKAYMQDDRLLEALGVGEIKVDPGASVGT
ncbi:hypothetical protein K7432_018539, partial [Basidiobolus ranarum]